jgi:heme/copper-type cytochrome/quinol oxidase subunit 2
MTVMLMVYSVSFMDETLYAIVERTMLRTFTSDIVVVVVVLLCCCVVVRRRENQKKEVIESP